MWRHRHDGLVYVDQPGLADLTQLVLVAPPMFGGLRAFNGPSCPYPP